MTDDTAPVAATLAEEAYATLGNTFRRTTLRGAPMPPWNLLPASARDAFTKAVAAVRAQERDGNG